MSLRSKFVKHLDNYCNNTLLPICFEVYSNCPQLDYEHFLLEVKNRLEKNKEN